MRSSYGVEGRVRAPEPTIAPIASLAQRVLSGDIVLPKFQRGFAWTPEQVLYLLDSVRRNYPIGSLLMWRTTAKLASGHEIAGLDTVPQHEGSPAHYVLDGQQRLASLVGALHGSGPLWDIAYDLEREEFLHRSEATPVGPHIMPVRYVNSVGAMLSWVREHAPDPWLQRRAEALSNQFSHYQVPVVTLLDVSEEDSARIFERINSTGTSMDIVDLVRAGTWARDFDLKEEIEQLLRLLDAKKYGRVDTKTMLRTIAAAAGLGFSTKDIHRLRRLDRQSLRQAVAEAGTAAGRAVDFLCTQIRTPKAETLPYYNQFAVLVEVFRQLPKPTTAQYDAVTRWFWLTASGEYFKGWRESQMGPDLQAVTAFAEGRTQEIETGAALPRSVLWQRSPFSQQNAQSKLLALLLSYEDPADLNTGRRIDVGKALSRQNDKQFHHFFPRAWLRMQGVSAARANACGNLVMLTALSNNWISDRAPSRYLKDLAELNGEDVLRARLRSCLVEEDAYQAALRDDYDGFLRVRSETLHRRLMGLIGSAADGSDAGQAGDAMSAEPVPDAPPDDSPVDRDSVD